MSDDGCEIFVKVLCLCCLICADAALDEQCHSSTNNNNCPNPAVHVQPRFNQPVVRGVPLEYGQRAENTSAMDETNQPSPFPPAYEEIDNKPENIYALPPPPSYEEAISSNVR